MCGLSGVPRTLDSARGAGHGSAGRHRSEPVAVPATAGEPTGGSRMQGAIYAEGLVKTFKEVRALDGVDLKVPEGTVLGLLGPNGAGKTTAVRVLTTLLKPDKGRAVVAGIDVLKHPNEVRRL